jgi:GT2 family glycosyltransferase
MSLSVLTVTYGQRWNYLSQMIEEAFKQGAERVLVVDNGCPEPISSSIPPNWKDTVHVIRLEQNGGSATGFAAGFRAARDLDSDYLLVLDDDNVPSTNAISLLTTTYIELARTCPPEDLILAGNRVSRRSLSTYLDTQRSLGSGDSFLGFRIQDIPRKLVNRARKKTSATEPNKPFKALSAPYGGLFLSLAALRKHGIPDERLILYADDVEYTLRMGCNGGKVFMVPQAEIIDLEESWNSSAGRGSALAGWLEGNSDERAYYGARNHAYVEYRFARSKPLLRNLNKLAYLSFLLLLALRSGKVGRYKLILGAVRDGEAGKLGYHANFALR